MHRTFGEQFEEWFRAIIAGTYELMFVPEPRPWEPAGALHMPAIGPEQYRSRRQRRFCLRYRSGAVAGVPY